VNNELIRYERKQSRLNVRYCLGIYMQGMRKTTTKPESGQQVSELRLTCPVTYILQFHYIRNYSTQLMFHKAHAHNKGHTTGQWYSVFRSPVQMSTKRLAILNFVGFSSVPTGK
jgi:hypothetical protein